MEGMEAVYPATASALARGRRLRRRDNDRVNQRQRHRTMPVTFAEIKEVDEDSCADDGSGAGGGGGAGGEERRRRPDVLDERLGRQFAEFRRRRARTEALRELSPPAAPGAATSVGPARAPAPARALSDPDALHRGDDTPPPPAAPHT